MNKKQKKILFRIIVTSLLFGVVLLAPLNQLSKTVISLFSYFVIGYDIIKKALKGIGNRRFCDENFLMTVATFGAVFLGFYSKNYDFSEAVAVMLFYQTGELFQSYAVGKSRKNIASLMDIRPMFANVYTGGEITQIDPDEVAIGSVIIVNPGERVPIDGIVIEGTSSLNTSALTGESMPRDIAPDDEIISGCINMTGVLKIRTTKAFSESTVSKILEFVENATSRKSKSEKFISKFARFYTPAVTLASLCLFVIPPVISIILKKNALWGVWLYRALTFLVISCPCALVISIPLTFFAAIGGASKEGILIKGSSFLEALSKTKIVVFDKTGTITKGVFEITGIYPQNISKEKLIEYAALSECASSHPIGQCIKNAYGKEISFERVSDIKEIAGQGITAKVDGIDVAVGNQKLMESLSIPFEKCTALGTLVYVAKEKEYLGCIVICDTPKPSCKLAISSLKKSGIEKTIMLTGDINSIAKNISEDVGIDEVFSDLLPQDKVNLIEDIIKRANGKGKVAFAGDGINDAPSIARADIGIAMGALGSDAAIEAADVVLMDDEPMKISKAIKISKKCVKIAYENIVFALGIKFICLILSAAGSIDMWLAIFADVGVMLLAIINSIRALNVKNL